MDIALWTTPLWSCANNLEQLNCRQKAAITAPGSEFAKTVSTWLKSGASRLSLRCAGLVDCTGETTNATAAVCGQKDANCIRAGRYCVADPDGSVSGDTAGGAGREALVELLRQQCIHTVRNSGSCVWRERLHCEPHSCMLARRGTQLTISRVLTADGLL